MKRFRIALFIIALQQPVLAAAAEKFGASYATDEEITAAPTVTNSLTGFDQQSLETLYGGSSIPKFSHLNGFYSKKSSKACFSDWNKIRAAKPKTVKKISQAKVELLLNKVRANGLNEDYAKMALATFAANQESLPNQNFVTFIDFDRHSSSKRMVIMDLQNHTLKTYAVAAGKGSDPDGDGNPNKFSNKGSSYTSSLGCAVTGNRFIDGKGRKALFIHGIEESNDRSCQRDVIMHPASYVGSTPGRSWGCPAVKPGERKEIYNKIAEGSLICSYWDPSKAKTPKKSKKGKKHGKSKSRR